MIKAGVIGLGVGAQHLKAYSEHPEVEITAICDFDHSKLKYYSKKFDVQRITTHASDLTHDPNIDLISIASFDAYHAEQIIQAISNQKHVFVEKPLCTSTAELEQIKKTRLLYPKVLLSSNLILRKEPRFQKLKERIDTGLLGNIYFASGTYDYGRFNKMTDGWRGDDPNYSVMQGGGIHILDLLMWLLDADFSPEYTTRSSKNSVGTKFNNPDLIVTNGRFSNGAIGQISANYGSCTRHFHQIKLYGTQGTFVHDCGESRYFFGREPIVSEESETLPFPSASKGAFIPEFIDAIMNRPNKTSINFETVCKVMETVLKIEECHG